MMNSDWTLSSLFTIILYLISTTFVTLIPDGIKLVEIIPFTDSLI